MRSLLEGQSNFGIKTVLFRLWLAVCSYLLQALDLCLVCEVWLFILNREPGLYQKTGSILEDAS